MALNSSGPISIGGPIVGQSINLELNYTATTQSSIGQASFRALAKVPTGTISLYDFYGKSNVVTLPPITTNTTQYTLSPAVVPGYIAGSTSVQLTIGANVYLYSTDVATPALNITGFVSGDSVSIINNGYILGKGGKGGKSAPGPDNVNAQNGGNAISLSCPATFSIENNLYVAAGGGGGSSGGDCAGGGGAGGGDGGDLDVAAGGAGGGPGQTGGIAQYGEPQGGAGGGRILPGLGGAGAIPLGTPAQGGGAGGGGGSVYYDDPAYSYGGAGGAANNVGGNSHDINPYGNVNQGRAGGGGGGWGASGGNTIGVTGFPPQPVAYYGGAGGKAIALNGHTITITGYSSQIYGSVS